VVIPLIVVSSSIGFTFPNAQAAAMEPFGGRAGTAAAMLGTQQFVLAGIASKNVLIVLERTDEVSAKSLRNLPEVHVLWVDQLNAYDVIVSDDIVFTKAAFDAFVAAKAGVTEEVSA